MEQQMKSLIKHIHKKVSSIVPVMLMIKCHSIKYKAFYVLMFLCKFICSMIITSNFNLTSSSFSIPLNNTLKFLRFFTAHSIITTNMTSTGYIIGSVIILILQCINIAFFIWYCFQYKKRNTPQQPSLSKIFIALIHFHLIFGQVEIEYLSFSYYILGFNSTFIIKNTLPQSVIIVFAIINSILIVLVNIENYFLFQSINTPFTQSTFPMKIRISLSKIGLILFMENVTILESFELYVNDSILKPYKIVIFSVLAVCLMISGIVSLDEYNYKSKLNDFLAFLSAFIFTSVVIEVIIYLTRIKINSDVGFIFCAAWKVIIAIIIMYIMKIFNKRRLNNNCRTILFKVYDYKLERRDFDTFLYILDLLQELAKSTADSQKLISILYHHKKECFNEKCKCQLIQVFISQDPKNKAAYIQLLISRIGYLIETSFVQVDYSNDYNLSILLSEYFFNFKQNSIMAYSIIQTYFYSNLNKVNIEQIILIYSISQKYIIKSTELIDHEPINYSDFYLKYRQSREIYKNMIHFYENFNIINNAKSSFENSLKISYDFNTGEVKRILSPFLTSVCLNNIINTISILSSTYIGIIRKVAEWSNNIMTIEFNFKVYLFFFIMNAGKLPKEIKGCVHKFINQHLSIDNSNRNDTKMLSIDLTTILYKLYESKEYSYYVILKFIKGFQIVYFSEKLANDLGFAYSSLIGEDLNIIFPKKFREIHQKAVVNFLITQQHYSFFHSSFIFTSQGHAIPCTISISSIPGIAKNLTIICNINILPQDNKYSFMLNEKFEAISLSNTFDTKYALSLKLINDFDINLLEIFNIQPQALNQTFENQIKKIQKFKRTIEVSTALAFSRILYCNHLYYNNNDNDMQLKRFKVFELQKEVKMKEDDLTKSKLDIELMYSTKTTDKQKPNTLILKRCKSEIVQNLLNLINKFNEMELYDERYKKLNEALYKFKASMKNDAYYQKTIKETCLFIEAIAANNYDDSSYYHLSITVKEIYDQPLYLVKISEETGSLPPRMSSNKKVNISRSPLLAVANRKRISNTTNNNNNEDQTPKFTMRHVGAVQFQDPINNDKCEPQFQSPQASEERKKKLTSEPTVNTLLQNRTTTSTTSKQAAILLKPIETASVTTTPEVLSTKKKIKKLLIRLTNLLRIQNNKQTLNKTDIARIFNIKSTFLIIGLFACLIISFSLALALFLYQSDILNIYHLLFENIHHILFQRDKLLSIYCVSLGILYKVSTITTTDQALATEKDIAPYYLALENDAALLDDLYHHFYYIYLNYKDKEGKSYDEMLLKKDFNQIKLTWKPSKYSSDFFTEMLYLSIIYNKAIISNDALPDISQDVNQFLFNTFITNPNKEVMSDYGRLMYYFGANYLIVYETFAQWFVNEMNQAIIVHQRNSQIQYLVIQLLVLIVYMVFFTIVYIYLIKHNNIIFKSIVRIFVFTSPGEKYTYKNQYYNYSLFQKINDLKNVTHTFNVDNLSVLLLTDKLKIQCNMNNLTQMTAKSSIISSIDTPHIAKESAASNSKSLMNQSKISQSRTTSQVQVKRLLSNNLKKKDSQIEPSMNINTTSSHLNSSNNNNTQSQFLLSRKLTKSSVLDDKDNATLTKTQILDHTVNCGIKVIKWLKLCSTILFVIFVIYFLVTTIVFLSIINRIQFLFVDFNGFVNYYSLAYLYFNELRIKLISPLNTISDDLFKNMTDQFAKTNLDTITFINTRLKQFSHSYELFNHLNRNTTDGTKEDLQFLCNNNTQCMSIILKNDNEIISQGINLAVESIFLQLTNLYGDYLNAKDKLKTVSDVTNFLKGNLINHIEETLSFVLNSVKEVIYDCLMIDEKEIMEEFNEKVNVFNFLSFAYCCVVFILVMFGIIINVQRHVKPIVFGAYKLNKMFYYNYLLDTQDAN